MLLTKDLIKNVEPKYVDMLKQVNIPNFTKCIAQFAGLEVKEIQDEVIKNYLLTWAKNKYKFFDMLGNKLQLDMPIEYKNEDLEKEIEYLNLGKKYPAYSLWLDGFKYFKINKINNFYDIEYMQREKISELFPENVVTGSAITHFFKNKLQAPDELVTEIGRIYELDKVEGTYTISIDPVDMMLASENPYSWNSCYRLAMPNSDSHADGCLAAVLDTSNLITYIWSRSGKFELYDKELTNIRYKKIREWIAIHDSFEVIHFNNIYPAKNDYSDEFEKQLRYLVEDVVDKYLNEKHKWFRDYSMLDIERKNLYGYSEYENCNLYFANRDWKPGCSKWEVYDEPIYCPCGCGEILPGSDDEDWEYTGSGFMLRNFEEAYHDRWCDYCGDYCEYMDDEDCTDCNYWRDTHPVCRYDEDNDCNDFSDRDLVVDDGQVTNCGYNDEHCKGCPLYDLHHQDEQETTVTISTSIADVNSAFAEALRQYSMPGSNEEIRDWTYNIAVGVDSENQSRG